MIVDPPQEDFFVSQFLHDIDWLIFFSQEHDLRMLFESDFAAQINLCYDYFTLIICQMRPKTMCYLFYMMRSGWMLTTVHPIAFAD